MAVLKKGSKGAAVKKLQNKLNAYKYKLETDGIFGPKTDEAVRAFQKRSGLKVDGLVGPNTLAALDMKSSGAKSAGKKSSGGGGMTLTDWPGRNYILLEKKALATFKPYPNDHKKRAKHFAQTIINADLMTGRPKSKEGAAGMKRLKAAEVRLLASYKVLDVSFYGYFNYVSQMGKQMEKYASLSKHGKFQAALDVYDAVTKEDKKFPPLQRAFVQAVVDYDDASHATVELERILGPEWAGG